MQIQKIQQCLQQLDILGQHHLVQKVKASSIQHQELFVQQYNHLNSTYPGGLSTYLNRAKQILQQSKQGKNPYQDYTPSIPKGFQVDFHKPQFNDLQKIGTEQLKNTCFVLVAGGLGQRLGYPGIKIQIPIQLQTQMCFIQYYVQFILAIQKRCNCTLPLAIMTSDDTIKGTVDLLQRNKYFGMQKDQITIMKQQKVAAMLDNQGKFALNQYLIQTKPHGHGDVHTLLYQYGLTKKWFDQGRKWVFFFQDTNPLIFRSLTSCLGISKMNNLKVNSVAIPRKPQQPVGAIILLTHKQGNSMTINVQYNQLKALLKDHGGQSVDEKGYSKFPGNTNGLIFELQDYCKVLQQTKGTISQFINPKYADQQKNKFKSSTRLECMMQDYPKLLKSAQGVSFTMIDRRFCFSTVKNDLETAKTKHAANLIPQSASSCQSDFNWLNRQILKICGAQIEQEQQKEFSGIKVKLFPQVFIHPNFGITLQQIRNKIGKVQIKNQTSLVIRQGELLQGVIEGQVQLDKQLKCLSKQCLKLIETVQDDLCWYKIRGYKIK